MNYYIPPTLTGPATTRYRMSLTVGEHSPRYVRCIVRSYLCEWGMPELANVVRHVPDRHCTFLLLRQGAGVRVEVADGSPRLPVTPTDPSPDAEGGRGLVILGAVADKWGVEPRAGCGKTVWFECGRES
ncbi:ATP-binding protein [Streptomyces sp. MMBL 11-3]|uniref:ATP-binding protein n=1 Tax=Streptomyces sp. MMBL 11-3 TaxID=3382639 RepID=UPI0039B67F9C